MEMKAPPPEGAERGSPVNRKKPYGKPVMERIPLRPEEAVLGFCKVTGPGPLQADCSSPSQCPTAGS